MNFGANPYHPYSGLRELLDAAGVPPESMNAYTTPSLLRMAAERGAAGTEAPAPTATSTKYDGGPWVTKSVRMNHQLAADFEHKCRLAGSNANAVTVLLIRRWLEE